MKNARKMLWFFIASLRILAITACFILFILMTLDICNKFIRQMTSVGIQTCSQDNDTKLLPCMTACAGPAFKNMDYSTTRMFYAKHHLRKKKYSRTTNTFLSSINLFFNWKKSWVLHWAAVTQFVIWFHAKKWGILYLFEWFNGHQRFYFIMFFATLFVIL